MGTLDDFLSHESPAPEPVEPDVANETPLAPEPELIEPQAEASPPAEPQAEEQPPTGDKRDTAIWREERERRKELQRQVEQMNTRWQEMVSRMQQPPAPTAEAPHAQAPEIVIPPFEEDPIGHLKAKNDLLEQQLTEARQVQDQQTRAGQQMAQFQQMRATVDGMETQFAQAHPDYNAAVGHMYEQVGKMATAMGYPPEARQQIIQQTAMDISLRALQAGRNPAEMAYEAARAMGWGGAPAPTAHPAPQASMHETRATDAPTSLGAVAGKPAGGTPTWDAISKMSGAEFDKWWKDFERQQRGR